MYITTNIQNNTVRTLRVYLRDLFEKCNVSIPFFTITVPNIKTDMEIINTAK